MLVTAGGALLLANAQANGEPSLEAFKELVEPAIRAQLIDPQSARFEWPYGFHTASNGLVTCGHLNSKNRMGGYAGKSFVLVVNQERPPYFNIAEDDSNWDGVTGMCHELIKKGELLPR